MLSGKSVASPARAKSGLSWFWSLIPVNPWVVASCRSEPGVVIMPPMLLVEVLAVGHALRVTFAALEGSTLGS